MCLCLRATIQAIPNPGKTSNSSSPGSFLPSGISSHATYLEITFLPTSPYPTPYLIIVFFISTTHFIFCLLIFICLFGFIYLFPAGFPSDISFWKKECLYYSWWTPKECVLMIWLRKRAGHPRNTNYVIRGLELWATWLVQPLGRERGWRLSHVVMTQPSMPMEWSLNKGSALQSSAFQVNLPGWRYSEYCHTLMP